MANKLEDFKVNLRLQIATLWTSVLFCYIYGDYFELYVPNKVAGLVNGQNMLDSPIKLLTATVLLTIPILMISLSVFLKPNLAKWLNIGSGIFYTLFTLSVGISAISEWRIFYVFLSFLESIVTVFIVYKAWTWPTLTIK